MSAETNGIPTEIANAVLVEVEELIARKAVTREIGRGPIPPASARFVTAEFERADEAYERGDGRIDEKSRALAARYFREAVVRHGR